MATEKQLAANRRNAQKSTGPRTAAGRKRSGRNALKHGLATPLSEIEKSEAALLAASVPVAGDLKVSTQLLEECERLLMRRRVRNARARILEMMSESIDQTALWKLAALERYERRVIP